MYDDPAIGSEGFAYWKFANGEVHLITPESSKLMGRYQKRGDVWTFVRNGGEAFYLEPSVNGIAFVDPKGASLRRLKRLFVRPTVPTQKLKK
jgi:hypothetical protein